MSWTIGLFIQALAGILALLIYILIFVAQYNEFVTAPPVVLGWAIIRDVSNMFFVLMLLLISIGTILRLSQYKISAMLPKVLLMAVLVNFSKTIAGLLIDFSQIVTLTFISAVSDIGPGNILEMLNLKELWNFGVANPSTSGVGTQLAVGSANAIFTLGGIVTTYLFAMVLTLIAVVVVLILVLFFVQRLVALWILVVFSPLAYVLSVVPQGSKYASKWWDLFSKYLITGPIMAFLLWLAFASLASNVEFRKTLKNDNVTLEAPNATALGSASGQGDNMIAYIISVAMLMASIYAAKEVGNAVGSAAGKSFDKIVAQGTRKGAAVTGLSYLNERFAGRTGVSLNPVHWQEAFRKARDQRREQRTKSATGLARDVMQYGMWKTVKLGAGGVGQIVRGRTAAGDFTTQLKSKRESLALAKETRAKATGATAEAHRVTLLAEAARHTKLADDAAAKRTQNIEKIKEAQRKLNEDPDNQSLRTEIGNLTEENERLERVEMVERPLGQTETERVMQLSVRELNGGVEQKARSEIKIANAQIDAINNGTLTGDLAGKKIADINNEIAKVNTSIDRMVAAGQNANTGDARQQLRTLERKRDNLLTYTEALRQGDIPSRTLSGDVLADARLDSKYNITDEAKAQLLDGLNKQVALANVRVNEKRTFTLQQERAIDKDIQDLDKDVKSFSHAVAEMKLPNFYRVQARRDLVGEELKHVQSINNDDELIRYFKQARDEGEKYKMMAVLQKMAHDGNDNEFLNGLGKSSDFEGYKEFFEKEVAGHAGISRQEALSLANDISYVNEERNHWETARTVAIDHDTGEFKWKTASEHVDEALAEILKKNPQDVFRRFNRLAIGGEVPQPGGAPRKFKLAPLGAAFLEYYQNGGYVEKYARDKQMGANMTTNLYNYLKENRIPEFEPTFKAVEAVVGKSVPSTDRTANAFKVMQGR